MAEKEVECAQLLDMPKVVKANEEVLKQYEAIKALRSDVLKALEENRAQGRIGSAQEATVYLTVKDEFTSNTYNLLSSLEKSRLFIVSSVVDEESENAKDYEVSKVEVRLNEGQKCLRCWNRFETVDENGLCPRCAAAFKRYEQL
jgi:isoleucyl-tRNA synthetase